MKLHKRRLLNVKYSNKTTRNSSSQLLNEKNQMKSVLFYFLVIVVLSCSDSEKKQDELGPPNLVVFFPDQFRAHALGLMNDDPVITPNLDRLAQDGVIFTNAVANYPLCSPTRAMFMTGKYPFQTGIINNCVTRDNETDYQKNLELKTKEICWSDILKSKGYHLGYIGKWHLEKPKKPFIDCLNNKEKEGNKWNEWTPFDRRHGFDYWYAYNTYDYHMKPLYWSSDAGRNHFHYANQWSPIVEADKAIQYIENRNGSLRDPLSPFALVVAMNPPHDDGVGAYREYPKKYEKFYEGKTYRELANRPNIRLANGDSSEFAKQNIKDYFTMVTGVDEQIGRVLKTLKKQGLEENTIVLVLSDHGDLMGSHDLRDKNMPYEEAMRIPLILKWPKKLKPDKSDLMLSVPDVYPTLMGLMGFEDAIPKDVSGKNYTNHLFGREQKTPSSQLYLSVGTDPQTGMRGLRTKRYTMVVNNDSINQKLDDLVLYDRLKDPYQLENIAYQNPQLMDSLKTVLSGLLTKTNDPFKIQ